MFQKKLHEAHKPYINGAHTIDPGSPSPAADMADRPHGHKQVSNATKEKPKMGHPNGPVKKSAHAVTGGGD